MRVSIFQVAASTLLACSLAFAQAAPRDNPSVSVGGKNVSVEYGKPALGDRNLADLLEKLPGDRMWRAGSEQVTTLSTETALMLGGKKLAPGKYSLYVHCGEDGSRALAVNKVLGQPLGKVWDAAPDNLKEEPWPHFKYSEEIAADEVARAPMTKTSLAEKQDRFDIALKPAGDGATMVMSWGKEAWSVDLKPAK